DLECHVDFPDGTTQVFWRLMGSQGVWLRSAAAGAQWHLHAIVSNLANTVEFNYSSSYPGDNPFYQQIWTVKDTDRTSVAYFGADNLLQRLDLPSFDTGTATYSLSRTWVTFPDPGYHLRTISALLLTGIN